MKRPVILRAMLLAALATGGVSAGRWLRDFPVAASAREAGVLSGSSRGPRARPAGGSAAPVASHDLAALRRFAASMPEDDSGEARQMARVPTAELKAMIVSVFAKITDRESAEDAVLDRTFTAACKELSWRDGRAAYEWASALSSERLSSQACTTILMAAASRDPALAEELTKIHLEKHGDTMGGEMDFLLLKAYMERGDMAAIARLVAEKESLQTSCPVISLPPDFDFPGLMKALDGKVGILGPVLRWSMRDPEAAWAYVAEHHPTGKVDPQSGNNLFNGMFHASILRDGPEKGVAWTVEKISALPPEQRTTLLEGLQLLDMDLPEDAVGDFLGALSADDRQTVVNGMRRERFSGEGNLQNYLNVLDALPREEMLAELTRAYQSNLRAFDTADGETVNEFQRDRDKGVRRGFSEAGERLQLTPLELERIRGDGR